MDIRVEVEDDGTLSVYEAPAFSGLYTFVRRGPAAVIVAHHDVSGSMRKFFDDETLCLCHTDSRNVVEQLV